MTRVLSNHLAAGITQRVMAHLQAPQQHECSACQPHVSSNEETLMPFILSEHAKHTKIRVLMAHSAARTQSWNMLEVAESRHAEEAPCSTGTCSHTAKPFPASYKQGTLETGQGDSPRNVTGCQQCADEVLLSIEDNLRHHDCTAWRHDDSCSSIATLSLNSDMSSLRATGNAFVTAICNRHTAPERQKN